MNQMPPKNIESSDLWAQIIQQPRAFRIIDSPLKLNDGSPVPIAIWVLTQEESQICTIEAERFTRKMLKEQGGEIPKSNEMSEGYHNLYETRAQAEILAKACRNPADLLKPFFPSVPAISKKLTTDEIGVLLNQYIIIQQEIGPIVSHMEEYEFNAWIEKLAKGGSASFLGSLTSAAQNQFIMSMANQLWKLQMDKCSVGMQPDEISNKNSNNQE